MKLLVLFLVLAGALAKKGFGPTDQEWGYVEVRPKGHLFWWLHYTTANIPDKTSAPLIIWLQGGPGGSSTGFGNFGELGPLDEDLNERNTSWVHKYNVMFVDNPVGTGFSYVEDNSLYVKDNKQIALDFVAFLKSFYKDFGKFSKTPLYIFCESYGGKMTAEIALELDKAIKKKEINCNFKGVGLGDSWISPIDSVLTWGPYLYQLGVVDSNGLKKINDAAEATKKAVEAGKWEEATSLWGGVEGVVGQVTHGVDFYNVIRKTRLAGVPALKLPSHRNNLQESLLTLMNNKVKPALGLNSTWIEQNGRVFNALSGDFMKPVTNIVESLLNSTDIRVIVYNGQLDLIVDTPGTVKWVDNLKWKGSSEWQTAPMKPVTVHTFLEGYIKTVGKLSMVWVNRAGHMVPADNPAGMSYILDFMVNND